MPPAQIPPERMRHLETLYREQRFSELVQDGQQLSRAYPRSPLIWNVIGSAEMALRHFEDARMCFAKALALRPDYPDALNNLGLALSALDRQSEAIAALTRAVALQPQRADLHSNLGIAYREAGQKDEAVASLRRSIALDPNYAFAHQNLGVLLQDLGKRDEAIQCFARVLEIDPRNDRAAALRQIEMAHMCDWDAMDYGQIASLGLGGDPIPPSLLINLDDNPQRNFIRAERYAAANYGAGNPVVRAPPPARPQRLRLGYFSADFHDHATMHLMVRLLEVHDRDRFEVHAFSYGRRGADAMQARVRHGVDAFHDVRELSDAAIAELANREAIDIAIDLKGDTTESRFGIFAHRPAPVQIAYLGFPGTMGAPFIDYIIADKVVLPEAIQPYFAEKPIYLPHSYQANDDTRTISSKSVTRADAGLPEHGFVFCCFNNSFKITPAEFDIWMRLLKQTEESVLWLLDSNAWVAPALRKQAERRGVDPSRIVFADRASVPEHLARQPLADVFLDTFACNAHTTASDALWAGLPVITMPGASFNARVAASLLTAIGLPELITASAEAYEALALALARDPERLRDIKEKLSRNRLSAPLFNSTLFARHIEQAYDAAYQRYLDGKAPDVIEVAG